MSKRMMRIHDLSTNEIIDREMTAEEVAEAEAYEIALATQQADLQAKEAARQAVLSKLGLTAEEAAALLS